VKKNAKGIHRPSKHDNVQRPKRATSAIANKVRSLESQRMLLMRVIAALGRGQKQITIPFAELNTASEIGLAVERRDDGPVMLVYLSDVKAAGGDLEPETVTRDLDERANAED
jgi:hypothetical protein